MEYVLHIVLALTTKLSAIDKLGEPEADATPTQPSEFDLAVQYGAGVGDWDRKTRV